MSFPRGPDSPSTLIFYLLLRRVNVLALMSVASSESIVLVLSQYGTDSTGFATMTF
jgi:hypothetical protein